MNYDVKAIGKRIKKERIESGFKNQGAFAKAMNYSQESRQTVANWENGKTIPCLEDMLKMCELFDCELGYLLCEFDNKTRQAAEICDALGISREAEEKLKNIKNTYHYKETMITLSKMIESKYFLELLEILHHYRLNFNKNKLVFYNEGEEEIVSKALGCDKNTDVREYIKASSRYRIEETFMKVLDDLK